MIGSSRALLQASAGAGGVSTPWELTNAAFNGGSFEFFSVAAQASSPTDVFFKNDGTKMYVVGSTTDAVYEYNLSSAWDVRTASYVQNFSVATEETTPQGLFFKSDGTKMYIVGQSGVDVNEYSLSSAWDVSTASYVQNFSVSAQDTSPIGLFFKPDGTKMYIAGATNNNIYEYDLSSAWDVSTASYVQSFSVSADGGLPNGVFFKDDGTKMYVVSDAQNEVNEYSLSSAWDISTASFAAALSVSRQESTPTGLFFKSDGTKMYISGNDKDAVQVFNLSSAWDISTASWAAPSQNYFSTATEELLPTGVFFKPDGTKMYNIGTFGDAVNEYSLSSAWEISTASYVQSFSVSAQDTAPVDVFFKPDGAKMYVLGNSGDDVNEYNLSSAWDISTASYVQNFSVATEETAPSGFFFRSDGTKMYVIGQIGDDVNEYNLSSAWNISTASYVQNFSVVAQENNPQDIFFKDDGTKMYVIGSGGDDVNEYDLSSAWDISTASYVQNFSVALQDNSPTGLFFKSDGTKMYIMGYTSRAVWAYDL